jgi:hypothetical protein
MVRPEAEQARWRTVRCPICIDTFPWRVEETFEYVDRDYVEVVIPAGADDVKRADILRFAYVKCPNPSKDMADHYLPTSLGSFGEGLVVGLVGATSTGKSHLLAAAMRDLTGGALQPYGAAVSPVNPVEHDLYLDGVKNFLDDGRPLPGTVPNVRTYAASVLVTTAAGTRPVTFFDVAGGDLLGTGQAARFIAGVGALLFVVDPLRALRNSGAHSPMAADPAFTAVLSRLRRDDRRYLDVPAAVAVTKSDRLRFQPPVDRWLHRETAAPLSAEQLRLESRDAYAFLYRHGARAWLAPFQQCRKCTMHFVSATGGELHQGRYPRGARPRRVLEPLLALFAMTGVLDSADAEKVGVWPQ